MNQTRRQFLRQTAIGVAAMLPLGTARMAGAGTHPAGTTAVAATDFLNSIGVCSSITGRGETLDGTIDVLTYTGIRFIRCGLEDRISVHDMVELHKRTGARIVYGLLSGGTDLDRLIREARQLASAGALLAVEGNNEPNNWGITYAMYRIDYAPKQAAHYLHNITTILADNGFVLQPGRLDYSIPNQPATVHDLLLQKSDGTFELVLWGERFAGGADKVTVNLGARYPTVKVYDPTTGTTPTRRLANVDSVALPLSNHPVVIELAVSGARSAAQNHDQTERKS